MKRLGLATFNWTLNLDEHSVFGGLERELAPTREHVVAHVGEDKSLRPNLREMAFERRQGHVGGDRLVPRVGLADEQIRFVADIDDSIGPLGVARKGDHFALRLETKAETGTGAVVVHHMK